MTLVTLLIFKSNEVKFPSGQKFVNWNDEWAIIKRFIQCNQTIKKRGCAQSTYIDAKKIVFLVMIIYNLTVYNIPIMWRDIFELKEEVIRCVSSTKIEIIFVTFVATVPSHMNLSLLTLRHTYIHFFPAAIHTVWLCAVYRLYISVITPFCRMRMLMQIYQRTDRQQYNSEKIHVILICSRTMEHGIPYVYICIYHRAYSAHLHIRRRQMSKSKMCASKFVMQV